MTAELRGTLPKLPTPFARTLINRAYKEIRDRNLWSFQIKEGQWISPAQITAGTATTTQGSTTIAMSQEATNAINTQGNATYSLLTQRQFRIGAGGIYNIYGWNPGGVASVTITNGGSGYTLNPTVTITGGGGTGAQGVALVIGGVVIGVTITSAGTGYTSNPTVSFAGGGGTGAAADGFWGGLLTIDRMYGEISVTNAMYQIYQVYYPSPSKTFLSFISVRDMQNFIDLFIAQTRQELDQQDPQRNWYYFPTWVVPYKPDPNPASATYGFMLHELWGAPQYTLNYQLLYIDKLGDLVNPSDTIPYAIGEDVVLAKARVYAYEWAEANKGALERNQGPDYRFLMGASQKQYDFLFKNYRREDKETVDNFFMAGRSSLYGRFWASYNSIAGVANPGW